MVTQIQVSDKVWSWLINKKIRPSQTFSDIIQELIDEVESEKRK